MIICTYTQWHLKFWNPAPFFWKCLLHSSLQVFFDQKTPIVAVWPLQWGYLWPFSCTCSIGCCRFSHQNLDTNLSFENPQLAVKRETKTGSLRTTSFVNILMVMVTLTNNAKVSSINGQALKDLFIKLFFNVRKV